MKRRLVGAVVLVSLAVIFLPVLLDKPKDYATRIERSNIPPPPEGEPPFRSSVLPLEANDPRVAPLPPRPEPAPLAAPAPAGVRPPPKSGQMPPEPRLGVSAWVVQLAALGTREKADRLQTDLRKQGFAAFVEPISQGGRELFRVRVGPDVDRARAERMAADIEKKLKQKGQVVRYP